MAHVTGGGIAGNLARVLPAGVRAVVDRAAWAWPPVFRALAALGDVPREEMERAFTLGVGMVLVLPAASFSATVDGLVARGEAPFPIGRIEAGDGGVELVGSSPT
jgi:phosphoribosylformylglycinamidine cyclo-ligase